MSLLQRKFLESSAPTMLWPKVRIPRTPSTLFRVIWLKFSQYLSFELECENNENKRKEFGIGLFKKNVLKNFFSKDQGPDQLFFGAIDFSVKYRTPISIIIVFIIIETSKSAK